MGGKVAEFRLKPNDKPKKEKIDLLLIRIESVAELMPG
jgi:hypothetical protein